MLNLYSLRTPPSVDDLRYRNSGNPLRSHHSLSSDRLLHRIDKNESFRCTDRPVQSSKKGDQNAWPLWMKVGTAAMGVFAVGVLLKSASTPGYRPGPDPMMCSQGEYQGIVSTSEESCVPKDMLKFFNDYFPNVSVAGSSDSEIGQETLRWLDHLGVQYESVGTYDRSTVPFEVWSKIKEYSVPGDLHQRIIDAVKANRPFTPEEKEGVSKLSGAAACLLNHRRIILKTINLFDQANRKLETLKKQPKFPEKENQLQVLKAEIKKYSSIFIFEGNARFGTVKKDGTVDLSPETAVKIERVFKALPKDWEYFGLFVNDWKAPRLRKDWSSKEFPGVFSVSEKDALVHPSDGCGTKAFAWSSRSYPDLKRLFSEIGDQNAAREYFPIDGEFPYLSHSQRRAGRRYMLVSVESLTYRKASISFHEKSFANKHFPSTNYLEK